jgi:DNA-directed RNA polymerase specialized sigma24 family protein
MASVMPSLHQPKHCPCSASFFIYAISQVREDELVIGTDDWRHMNIRSFVASNVREDPVIFAARFWRSYRLLHLIACRVLGGPERAEEAVDNCWQTASRGRPRFEYEGAFRSWLLRVLIDEALCLRKNHKMANVAPAEISIGSACAPPDKSISNGDQHQMAQRFSVALE